MDNHGLPEEYETDTRDMPFLETPRGAACLMIVIVICAATFFALVVAVIGG